MEIGLNSTRLWSIHSRFQRYKNYKSPPRDARVIVENNVAPFFPDTVCGKDQGFNLRDRYFMASDQGLASLLLSTDVTYHK